VAANSCEFHFFAHPKKVIPAVAKAKMTSHQFGAFAKVATPNAIKSMKAERR